MQKEKQQLTKGGRCTTAFKKITSYFFNVVKAFDTY